MKKLRVLSLFSGIGAFEKALTNIGVDFDMVGFSEIDKYATKSYCAIHNVDESLNLGDITKIDLSNLPNADLITHGSPCTSFSLAGKGAGGDKGSDTPSSLMWYSVEIINRVKPKYVIWENVKNVLSKKHRHNFDLYIDTLDKMGYKSYFEVLNAKNYGVPQNRERIFVISILGEHKPFIFPDEIPLKLKLKDILEESVEERYYLKDTKDFFIKNSFKMEYRGNGFRFAPHVKANANVGCTVTTRAGARMDDNFILDINSEQEKFEFSTKNFEIQANRLGGIFDTEKSKHQAGSVWDTEGLSPTLDTMQGGWRQPCIIDKLLVPQATKSGYIEMELPGVADLSYPNSKTRRGRVQEGGKVSPCIAATQQDICYIQYQGNEVELPCIAASRGRNPENPSDRTPGCPTEQRLEVNTNNVSNTLTTVQKDNYVLDVNDLSQLKIRKLTPKECWRLMSFSDSDIEKCISIGISNTQLYKQAGNSIVVSILEGIFKNLLC